MQAGRASTRLVQPRALTPSARLHTLSLTCVRVHKTIPRQLTLSIASLAPLPTACHACVCVLGKHMLNPEFVHKKAKRGSAKRRKRAPTADDDEDA